MDSKTRALTDGLLKAIQAENYGQNFYLMAAASTADQKGKEVFKTLAAEEEEHAAFLKAHYASVVKSGKLDNSVSLGVRTDLAEAWPIFSDRLKARIKDASFEMTSLSIGIQLEQDAMNFYREQADQHDEADVKKLFRFLSDWESGHYKALLKQYDAIKEDYWSANGFAPF
jgi:rubrerythrin